MPIGEPSPTPIDSRVANPLVLPFVYWLMRNEIEKQAQAGADALLRER